MTQSKEIAQIRKEYTLHGLDLSDIDSNPLTQFSQWFEEARQAEVPEPNAMHLTTVSAQGQPSGRIVLLKGLDETGFVFYTNYESHKGKNLAENPLASLTFFWAELERQVRIEGKVEKVSEEESTAYFHSRPHASQLGAWASPQSQTIESREVLENNFKELEEKYEEGKVPKPAHWGGFRLIPEQIEFWQGRPSRLHDRILYQKEGGDWMINRLAP
jgi:pyridoxamine 5'-phosphate oxidase